MDLCTSRNALPGNLSTCLVDTFIVPFPSLLLIFSILTSSICSKPKYSDYGWCRLPPWAHWLLSALVLTALGLSILEFVRLVLSQLGTGLLAAHLTGLSFALLLLLRTKTESTTIILAVFWLLLICVQIVKVIRLALENQLFPDYNSKYPSSSWLLDNVVSLVFYIIIFCFESWEIMLIYRSKRSRRDLESK